MYTYIGVAYVKDYKLFREIINKNNNNLAELNYFINKCKNNELSYFITSKWYDTCTLLSLNDTLKYISNFKNLNKLNEAIYFLPKKVIKYSLIKIIEIKYLGPKFLVKMFQRYLAHQNIFFHTILFKENYFQK